MLMKFKYEKEFRKAHPETIGEKESIFDLVNYAEWLETIVGQIEPLVIQKIAGIIDKEIADYEREIKIWNDCLEPEESTKPMQDRKNIIGILKTLKLKIASNFSA